MARYDACEVAAANGFKSEVGHFVSYA